jgi:hypothetical protein
MTTKFGKAYAAFINHFPDAILAGSAALLVHGISLDRDIGDLDILFNYNPNPKLGEFIMKLCEDKSDDLYGKENVYSPSYKFVFKDVTFNVWIDQNCKQVVIGGIVVDPVEGIISAKKFYASQGIEKHINDLKYLKL